MQPAVSNKEFIKQFYQKYAPDNVPDGERLDRLSNKMSGDFDGIVTQMYQKYAPDNAPDEQRLERLRVKYGQNQEVVDQNKAAVGSAAAKVGEAGPKVSKEARELPREDQNVVLPERNYDLIYDENMLQEVSENTTPAVVNQIIQNKIRRGNEDANISFGLNQDAKVFKEIEEEVKQKFSPEEIEKGEYETYFKDELKKRVNWVDPEVLDDESYPAVQELNRQIKSPGQQLRDQKKQKHVSQAVDDILDEDPIIFEKEKGKVQAFVEDRLKQVFGEDAVVDVKERYKDATFGESLFLNPEVFDPRLFITEDYINATGDEAGIDFHDNMIKKYLDKTADRQAKNIWKRAGNTVNFGMADPAVNAENQLKYYRQTMDSKIGEYIAPWNKDVYQKISEYEDLLTKKQKNLSAFSKKEMERFVQLSNEIQGYQQVGLTQVYDPYTGEYKAQNDPELSPQASQWVEQVDQYKEMYGNFGMSQMRKELDKEVLRLEELKRINQKYNADGEEDVMGARLSDDMDASFQKIQALSDMLIRNYDPAKDYANRDNVGEAFLKGALGEFGVEYETDYDLAKRNSDYLTEAGRPFNKEIQDFYTPNQEAQWAQELGSSASAGIKIGAELFIGNKLKGILGVSKFIDRASKGNNFKKAIYNHAFDANMYGLAYEAAGESYATGVGEYGGENLAGILGKRLKLNPGGIAETILKIGGGAAAEIPSELGGELVDRLVSGEGVNDAVVKTLGLDTEEGWQGKLSKVFWHSIALSGGGNLTGFAMNRIANLTTKNKNGTITPNEKEELEYANENYTKEWLEENTKTLLNDEKKISKYNEIKDLAPEALTDDEKLLKTDVEAVLKHGDKEVIANTKLGQQIANEEKQVADEKQKEITAITDENQELIAQKEEIDSKIQEITKDEDGKDIDLSDKQKKQVSELENQAKEVDQKIQDNDIKIEEIKTGVSPQEVEVKTEEDAVQKRKTEEVPVGEQAGGSQGVQPEGKAGEEKSSQEGGEKKKKVVGFEKVAKERVAKFKGLTSPVKPGKTKTVQIQSPEIGDKSITDEFQVTRADNALGVTVKRKNDEGNFETVPAKELDETTITVDGNDITLGEYLKQDMERQSKEDLQGFEKESERISAEIESDAVTYTKTQLSDLSGRLSTATEKRMKSPLRGVKSGVLSDAVKVAEEVYEKTGDLGQAYNEAYNVVKESSPKIKESSFDAWMDKELGKDYEILSPGEKMAANIEYARKRLRTRVKSAGSAVKNLLTQQQMKGKQKVVRDFLNSKETDKILKSIQDVQRLEKEGFSREEIQKRIDQIIDNAVKKKLIQVVEKESQIKDIAKDEKNKWKGINTIRWQNFNKVLKTILTNPEANIFDKDFYFVGNEYDILKELDITPAQANYLIRFQQELNTINEGQEGMSLDDFYSDVVALQDFRKSELEGNKSSDDEKRMKNREQLNSVLKGVYVKSREQRKLISAITKSTDQVEAMTVLDEQISTLESLIPEMIKNNFSQMDQIDVYSTLIEYNIEAARFATDKGSQDAYKKKAEDLINGFDQYFGVNELKKSLKENPDDKLLKRDLGQLNRLKGEINVRGNRLESISKVMDVKTGKSFDVWKKQLRTAIKESSSVVTAVDRKDVTQVDTKRAEAIGNKMIKKAQEKLNIKISKQKLKDLQAKGVQISINIQTLVDLLNLNKSKAYDQVFTNLFSVVDKAENVVYRRAKKMNSELIKALGLKSIKQLDKKLKSLNSDSKKVQFTKPDGRVINLFQMEMATLYNWIRDTENEVKLEKTAEEYGYRGDVAGFVKKVTDNAEKDNPDVAIIADTLRDFLQEYRKDLKEYYEEKLGVPYHFKDDYFPRKIHEDMSTLDMQKFDATELGFYNLNPTQVNTLHRRQTSDALSTTPPDIYRYIERYNKDLSYYLETYDALNDATRILNHDEFMIAVKSRVGETGYNVLKNSMKSVIMPPAIKGNWFSGAIRNYAISRLMLNTSSAIKQTASLSGYMTQGVWVDKLGDKKLMSDYSQFRAEDETRQRRYDDGGNLNEETGAIKEMKLSYDVEFNKIWSNRLRKGGAWLSKLSDKQVTNIGERIMFGRAVAEAMKIKYEETFTEHISLRDAYKLLYSKGAIKDKEGNVIMSEQKADQLRKEAKYNGYRATVEFTESSQQSSSSFFKLPVNAVDPNSWKQLLSFYKTSPVQQFSLEMGHLVKALRASRDPELTTKDKIGTMAKHFGSAAIYHAAIPMAFQYIGNGLPGLLTEWDDEDWEDLQWAMIMGNFNSLFMAGDFLEVLKNVYRQKPYGKEYAPIFMKFVNDSYKAVDFLIEDYNKKLIETSLATDKDSQINMLDYGMRSLWDGIAQYTVGGLASLGLGAMGINPDNVLKIYEAFAEEEEKPELDKIRGDHSGDEWISHLKSFVTSLAATSSYHRNKAPKPESIKKVEEMFNIEMPVLNAYKWGPIEYNLKEGGAIGRGQKHVQQYILQETNEIMDEWLRGEGLSYLQDVQKNINSNEDQKAIVEFQKLLGEMPDDWGFKKSFQNKIQSKRLDLKYGEALKKMYMIIQKERAKVYYMHRNADKDVQGVRDLQKALDSAQ